MRTEVFARWEIAPDKTLSPGDCIVETEVGVSKLRI